MPSSQGSFDPGPRSSPKTAIAPTTTFEGGVRTRGRGQVALAGITSTASFSNAGLSPAKRKLMLFCLLQLTRTAGTLSDAVSAVLATYAGDDRHWSHIPDEPDPTKRQNKLRNRICNFLGRGARRCPTWPEITGLITAVLPAAECDRVLPQAAGLYSLACGDAPPGYTGRVVIPDWAAQEVVGVGTIRAAISSGSPPSPQAAEVDPDKWKPLVLQLNKEVWFFKEQNEGLRADLALRDAELEVAHRRGYRGAPGDDAEMRRLAEQELTRTCPAIPQKKRAEMVSKRLRPAHPRDMLA